MADDAPVIGGLLMAGSWWAERERFASEAASLRALFKREGPAPEITFINLYEAGPADDIEELRRDVYADYEAGGMDVGTLIGSVARLAGLRRRRLARALME